MAGFLAKRARPGWRLAGLLSAIILAAMAPSTAAAQHLQCVPYARQVSGIDLYGNAHLWWDKAEGRFGRGSEPRVGAVMAFRASAAMPLGHVAVVGEIVDERHILLDHANWSGPGMIERRALAQDVSDAGDWSAVRVWWGPQGALGARENPVSASFITSRPKPPAAACWPMHIGHRRATADTRDRALTAFPLPHGVLQRTSEGMLRQYELVERVKAYDPDADEVLLNRAYVYTVQKHGSQKRASGDPYFSHPVEVAGLMTDLKLDQETIITALLHDTVEDTLATIADVEKNFGPEVARLVDGVTKLSKLEQMPENERAAENLRKFFLAMSEDIRVLMVKLGDRLHNMRTLHFIKSPEKRRRIARETMDLYAPLAERVGMYEYMREMQLLAFEQLEPEAYATITGRLEQIRSQEGGQVDAIALKMKQALAEAGFAVEVWGREKHPYSIWRKMAERHMPFEQITDIFAFRVLTDNVEDCYRALGVLHQSWQFVPGRFKDYISTPKTNGYRSLHTTLIYESSMRVEVQIRTRDMHRTNEYGLAAHWAYKQGDKPDGQVGWLRDLIEIVDASHDAEELLEHTRLAIYQDRIFAFTPKGSLFQLPKGATPVDFAFAVHTDLGAHTVGAKINGRHMPLRTQLNNGDVVEIIKGASAEPQLSWLGFVVTGKARAAIRRAVRAKEFEEVAEIGRQLFDQIAARLPAKIGKKAIAAAVERLELEDEDELMHAIGSAKLDDREVMEALVPGSTADLPEEPGQGQGQVISIKGLTPGMGFTLAECCHPVPGDRIVGLRVKGEGVTVHSIDCLELASGVDSDWVDLSWGERSQGAVGRLRVVLYHRLGTLAEMAGIFAKNHANVVTLKQTQLDDPFHTYDVQLEVQDLAHLTRIVSALRASDAVAEAERI